MDNAIATLPADGPPSVASWAASGSAIGSRIPSDRGRDRPPKLTPPKLIS
jgi:hypothetical protein